MTNAELIEALKDAEMYINYVAPACYAAVEAKEAIRIAADALEADEKLITEYIKNIEHWKKQVIRLRAQLPKEGEWIQMNGHRYCNVCGHKDSPILTNYCPNCGAKMRGEHDEQIH